MDSDGCRRAAARGVDGARQTSRLVATELAKWLSGGPLPTGEVCFLVGVQTAAFSCAAFTYLALAALVACTGIVGASRLRAEVQANKDHFNALQGHFNGLHEENEKLRGDALHLEESNFLLLNSSMRLRGRLHGYIEHLNQRPYEAVTGSRGHEMPAMYGKIAEKTIWSYWYHPVDCTSVQKCTLPAHIELCAETIRRNRGSFDYRILHIDEVDEYVNRFELPFQWRRLKPEQQKDALMNAILARYGGVALDISTVLLRPLDGLWDEMVAKKATFRGYMYRINGEPWRHPETMAVWFLMSRREGIFASAVRHQVIGMGDDANANKYRIPYYGLGDQTLLPILTMFNYSLPKCDRDDTVVDLWAVGHSFKGKCPENNQPDWSRALSGPPRNDTRILLRDPRDGPQLPFYGLKMAELNVSLDLPLPTHRQPKFASYPSYDALGAPMHNHKCSTQKGCWDQVFLRRFNAKHAPGEARLLDFVKLFNAGVDIHGMTRHELLSKKDTYFYNWLKLAGLPGLD